MNIYLHVETASRELDSKLLLAVRAAEKGHDVLITSIGLFRELNKARMLNPGIFHTKSLVPSKEWLDILKQLRAQGFILSSIDEEGGLVDFGYELFAKLRYSNETIAQVSAVFCWGPSDYFTLKRAYKQYSEKIFCTGSPRADLWRPDFTQYWEKPTNAPKRPYLLVSSNFASVNNYLPFWELIRRQRDEGYFDRVPAHERQIYDHMSEQIILLYEFVKAIEYIADNRMDIDIIVRPHPVENPESWKTLLTSHPNVQVIRNGPISPWLHNALAVLHNGCTTALEATISGIPVITYIPFEQKFARELPNKLGTIARSLDELLEAIDDVLIKTSALTKNPRPPPNYIVENKIRYREQELATDRIIRIWEDIGRDLTQKRNDWDRIAWNRIIWKRNLIPLIKTAKNIAYVIGMTNSQYKESYKFPPQAIEDIRWKVGRLSKCLGITIPIRVRMISDRAVIVTAS